MQTDLNIFWQNFWQQCWNTDTQIDVHAAFNLLSSSSHDFEPSFLGCIDFRLLVSLLDGSLFYSLLRPRAVWIGLEDFVDINCSDMYELRFNLPRLYDLLNLSNDILGSGGHICVEIASSLVEVQVTKGVCFLGLHQCVISKDCLLFDVLFAVEKFYIFRL